jgi:hypothetical protein
VCDSARFGGGGIIQEVGGASGGGGRRNCFGSLKLFLFVTKTDWFLVMGKCITLYCAVKFQLGTDPK